MGNSLASRADLLALSGKRRFESFTLPESGVTVRIRSLSELEQSQYEQEAQKQGDDGLSLDSEALRETRARLIVRCLVDDAGNLLLNDGDRDAVMEWDAADSMYLYVRLREFIGISRQVQAIEDAKKNSGKTDGNGSPTS